MELVIALLLMVALVGLDLAALRWGYDSRDAARGDALR